MTSAACKLPIVFLMGPTASGKSELAMDLCEHFPFDIVSVDSAMVYRGLDIGTAKPSAEVLANHPHRLIDICEPSEVYSAGDFRRDALAEIGNIQAQGRIPLLVGGTGLYFRALESGIAELPAADPDIRRRLEKEAAASSWQALHQRLREVDADSAARIHPNDPQRIQRALEVHELSGRPLSAFFEGTGQRSLDAPLRKIALVPGDRKVLHERIRLRFAQMMEFGLLDEVKALYRREELSAETPSMKTVGYRQVWQYLEGKLDLPEMQEKAVVATRQLAKRQFTWLRSEQDIQCFDSLETDFRAKVLRFLTNDPMLKASV